MRLTEGHYDLEYGYFYVYEHDVEEKPKTYKTSGGSLFYKDDEEYVRLLKGSDTRCPRLEVFTTDVVNPVDKLQSLLNGWMKNRMEMVPFNTKVRGVYQFSKESVRQYMESINLEEFNLPDVEFYTFPTEEDVDRVYLKLKTMDRPDFFTLKTEVENILMNLQEEIELD